jgi:hypothetical protein
MINTVLRRILSYRPNLFFGLVFPIILILIGVSLFSVTNPKVNNLVIAGGTKTVQSKQPVFETISAKNTTYIIDFETKYSQFTQKHLKLAITGCLEYLEINNKQYPIENLTGKITKTKVDEFREDISCDNNKFLLFDLTKFSSPDQTIKFQMLMQNGAGDVGFVWHGYEFDLIFVLILALINLGFFLIILYICHKLKLSRLISLIIFGGVLIREFYLSKTEFWFRSYDLKDLNGTGHLGFIDFVAKNLSLPNSDLGWQFHQAPLYYIINSFILKVGNYFELNFVYTALQFFNLIVFVGFIVVAILILKEFFLPKSTLDKQDTSWLSNIFVRTQNQFFVILGALLVCFLPSTIVHSVRISNDILFYLFSSLVIYFLLLYSKSQNIIDKNLILGSVFVSLGLATKVNSLILVVLLALVIISKFIIINNSQSIKTIFTKSFSYLLLIVVIISVGAGIGFYKKIEAKLADPTKDWLVTSETNLSKKLFVDNSIGNFLYFDAKAFLTTPFAQGDDDHSGRQSFLVYLTKTAIGSEFGYSNSSAYQLLALYSLVFIILIYFAYLLVTSKSKFFVDNWYVLLSFGLFFAGIAFYRAKTPCACKILDLSCHQSFLL